MSVRRVTQLELENFGQGIQQAEDADQNPLLSVADVRAKEILFRQTLIREGKIKADEDIPAWADVYQKLLNANIRPPVAAYIAWATMPKKYRYPETQDKLAIEVLGLTSDRAIATWRKKYPEIDMMISQLQAEEMLEYRPGAFHALGTVASDPTYRANPDRRLFFEMTKDYTPRIKNETDDGKGVGRKVLGELKKKSTADLLELLGPEALEMMQELEEELSPDSDLTPNPSPEGEGSREEDDGIE
ncbi:MAG TPA: hypothetical protein VJ987_14335 [Anaerolineales bacterium]|nr:hypothetical protein [Anaerolineales bacterium]